MHRFLRARLRKLLYRAMTKGSGHLWLLTPRSELAALFATTSAAQNGIPYSAQQVTERVQTLADGTRITQKPHKVNLYRAALGRTRSEDLSSSDTESEEITSVSIIDPVAGFRYSLDPSTHSARQWSLAKPSAIPASAAQKRDEGPQNPRKPSERNPSKPSRLKEPAPPSFIPSDLSAMTVQSRQLTKAGELSKVS